MLDLKGKFMPYTNSANIIALKQIISAIIFVLPDEEREKVKAIIECIGQLDYPNKIDSEAMTQKQLADFVDEMNSTYADVLEMVSTFESAKKD